MTGIFRNNNPLNATILFVYGLLLKLPWLLHHPEFPLSSSDGFLYRELISWLSQTFKTFPVLAPAIAYLLLFTQAISLNYYANNGKLMPKSSYLTAMTYLLVTSFFKEWNELSAPLIVVSLVIWIWGRLMSLNNNQWVKSTLFNLGFVIGICSFLYLPSIALILLVLVGLIITRPPRIAEWLMVLIGVLTTWYFLYSHLFLSDKLYKFDIEGFRFDLPELHWNVFLYIGLGLLILPAILGGYFVQAESSKQVIQVRKRWTVFLLSMVILLLMPLLNKNDDLGDWVLPLSGFAVFAAAAFYYIESRWVRLILHWGMVAFVLYSQYV